MIQAIIRDYLLTELVTVPIYMEQPKSAPSEWVLIELGDSGITNQICAATLFIRCSAQSMYAAAALSESVKDAMLDAVKHDAISSVKIGGERSGIDTTNHIYQYDLTFNIFYYKEG